MTARLAAFGHWLYRRQDVVRAVQWGTVGLYLTLLVGPLAAPSSPLPRLAEALFWGMWWPGVILSVMVLGQFWCGLLCPDGAVTECASRHGRGRKPAAWMRAGWLPLALFAAITLVSDAVDAQRSAVGTLVSVGGVSLAALAVGLRYGRGKRVWCRHLCPMAGLFSLLARCSALHFKVDRARWDTAPKPVPKPVDCPLLLDVRRLVSNEKCNMCGRCSGHRDAVDLAARPPGAEIATLGMAEARGWEAIGICVVLIGLCHAGAVAHGDWRAILVLTLVFGGTAGLTLLLAAGGDRARAAQLAYGLIPLGGLGLFLAALDRSVQVLAGQGIDVAWLLAALRPAVLVVGAGWSLSLTLGLAAPLAPWPRRRAVAVMAAGCAALAVIFQAAPALL